MPAPVDVRAGRIATVGMMRGWDGVVVPELLEAELGAPVTVDNDANLGALAETRFGAAVGHDAVAYLRVSHGVGGGLVLGGRVVHGRAGVAGEIGHVTIDENGPVCRCGNRGCLEMYVGAGVLLSMLSESRGHLTLRDVIARAQEGDPAAAASCSTPGSTSASRPRTCATSSTRRSSSSAGSSPRRARPCSVRSAPRSSSARSPARRARSRSSRPSWGRPPRCAARSPSRSTSRA